MPKLLVIQHSPLEGLGLFEEEIKKINLTYDTIMAGDDVVWPSGVKLEEYVGLIVLGGPMSAYEEARFPWIKKELLVIGEALRQKKPILGICLGAQMLAKAAGAKVHPGHTKEIGWAPIRLDDWFYKRNPVFFQLDPKKEHKVFHWHSDTFDIPTQGYRLAWNDTYPNQAFCIQGNAIGIQFHPEMTLEMVKSWCESTAGQMDATSSGYDTQKILAESATHLPELKEIAHKIFYGFAAFLRENTRRAA